MRPLSKKGRQFNRKYIHRLQKKLIFRYYSFRGSTCVFWGGFCWSQAPKTGLVAGREGALRFPWLHSQLRRKNPKQHREFHMNPHFLVFFLWDSVKRSFLVDNCLSIFSFGILETLQVSKNPLQFNRQNTRSQTTASLKLEKYTFEKRPHVFFK